MHRDPSLLVKTLSILAVLALAAASGCAIHAPTIQVTGEKSALEDQILGTYASLEKKTWEVASVRSSENEKLAMLSPSEKDAFMNIDHSPLFARIETSTHD